MSAEIGHVTEADRGEIGLPAEGRGRLDTIQMVRAAAALLVVATHGAKEVLEHGRTPGATLWGYVFDRGQFGVDLFFVISGFILTHISRARLSEPGYAQNFMIRRVARVVPVYWFYLTLMVILTFAAPQLKNHGDTNFLYLLASYFFVPMRRPSDGTPEPVLGLGWTLNFEMYFYLAFFLAILFFRPKAIRALLVYLVAAFVIGQLVHPHNLALTTWTSDLLFEFAFGVLIALAFDSRYRLSRPLAYAMLLGGLVLWLTIGLEPAYSIPPLHGLPTLRYRGFLWGVGAALVVASLALRDAGEHGTRNPALRALVMVGDVSYSLYLVHLFVMRVVTLAFHPFGRLLGGAYPFVYICVFGVASVAAAFASYRFIERPAERIWAKGLKRLFRTEASRLPLSASPNKPAA